MKLVRWTPFGDLERSWRNIDKPFGLDEFFAREDNQRLVPAVNIKESSGEYKIEAELPGFQKSDIKVNIENDILSIEAERKQEKDEEKAKDNTEYHTVERSYGNFLRQFTLPDAIAKDNVNAEYKNGILNLTLPKKEEEVKRNSLRTIKVA